MRAPCTLRRVPIALMAGRAVHRRPRCLSADLREDGAICVLMRPAAQYTAVAPLGTKVALHCLLLAPLSQERIVDVLEVLLV